MKRFLFLILNALLLMGPTLSLAAPLVTSDAQSPTIVRQVSTLADLKLVDITRSSIPAIQLMGRVTEGDGGEGVLRKLLGDQSANSGVLLDSLEGIFIKPAVPGDGSTGVWVREYAGPAQAEFFGAKGDGVTDDGAAFTAAGKFSPAGAGGKTYLINTSIVGDSGQHWVFTGTTLKSDTEIVILDFVNKSDFSITGSLTLEGSGASPVEGGQVGLRISGCRRYVLSGLIARECTKSGFEFGGNVTSADVTEKGTITNTSAIDNYRGWEFGTGHGGEYNVLSSCNAISNEVGVSLTSGNISWNGGNITLNVVGLELFSGSNEAHGIFSGVQFNHNTSKTLTATDISTGHTFDGCHFYGGALASGGILIENSTGIKITDSVIDAALEINSGAATLNGKHYLDGITLVQSGHYNVTGDDLGNFVTGTFLHLDPTVDVGPLTFPREFQEVTVFANGWVNFGTGRDTAGYFVDQNGIVHLKGMLKSGTLGLGAFALPSVYRPLTDIEISVNSNSAYGSLIISASSGDVIPFNGSNIKFSLDGVSFKARNLFQ